MEELLAPLVATMPYLTNKTVYLIYTLFPAPATHWTVAPSKLSTGHTTLLFSTYTPSQMSLSEVCKKTSVEAKPRSRSAACSLSQSFSLGYLSALLNLPTGPLIPEATRSGEEDLDSMGTSPDDAN